jgi:1-acyl-sn-glycerol-3-phosphate acyltransferase
VVANHVCWLDVLVLAAAGPVIPVLDDAVLQRSVTGPVVRRAAALGLAPGVSRDLSAAVQRVTAALRGGHRVLVFPHLRSPGHSALRFSRAPFQAAVDAAAVISPVALSYRSAPGSPAGPDDVLGSLWPILRTGRLTVRVTWLPVIPAVAGPGHRAGHRDAAARRTEWAIDRALDDRVPAKPAARPPRPLALAS